MMRSRVAVLLIAVAVSAVACNSDEPELTTQSSLITGATNPPVTTTTTVSHDGGTTASPSTTLVGEAVASFTVYSEAPNDDGVAQVIVVAPGAYTDVDLENFVNELLESNPDLYGAEILDSEEAAAVLEVDEAERTEEQVGLLERHHFVTLIGRDRFEFRGPFSDFGGGAIGS